MHLEELLVNLADDPGVQSIKLNNRGRIGERLLEIEVTSKGGRIRYFRDTASYGWVWFTPDACL